jgi:hypothetical protein
MEWPAFSKTPRVAFVTKNESAHWARAAGLIEKSATICEPVVFASYASQSLRGADLVVLLYQYWGRGSYKDGIVDVMGFVVVKFIGSDFYVELICSAHKGGGKMLLMETTKFATTARDPRTGLARFKTMSLSSVPSALKFYMRAAFVPGDADPCDRATWMAKRISARSGGYRYRKCLADHSPNHWGPPESGHPLPAKSRNSARTNQTSYSTSSLANSANSGRRKRARNTANSAATSARGGNVPRPRRRLVVVRRR